jgi:hypothetical protein
MVGIDARKPLRSNTINLRVRPFFIAFPFPDLGECPAPNITDFEVRFVIRDQPFEFTDRYVRTSLRFVRAGSILRLIYSRINQKHVFEDTRSILEPAGALSIAGVKAYVAREKLHDATLVAIASGANRNFDRLRHVSARTELGEERQAVLAAIIPERPGSFKTSVVYWAPATLPNSIIVMLILMRPWSSWVCRCRAGRSVWL